MAFSSFVWWERFRKSNVRKVTEIQLHFFPFLRILVARTSHCSNKMGNTCSVEVISSLKVVPTLKPFASSGTAFTEEWLMPLAYCQSWCPGFSPARAVHWLPVLSPDHRWYGFPDSEPSTRKLFPETAGYGQEEATFSPGFHPTQEGISRRSGIPWLTLLADSQERNALFTSIWKINRSVSFTVLLPLFLPLNHNLTESSKSPAKVAKINKQWGDLLLS